MVARKRLGILWGDSTVAGRDRKLWHAFFEDVELREGASIVIARNERGTSEDGSVAFTAGPGARIDVSRSEGPGVWRITGLVRDIDSDVNRYRVNPPTDREYTVWLRLPPLRQLVEIGADAGMIRAELRDELRDEVRDELRDELRDEVRDELRDELDDEVRDELRDELDDEVRDELCAEARDELCRDFGGDCTACPRPVLLVPVPARERSAETGAP